MIRAFILAAALISAPFAIQAQQQPPAAPEAPPAPTEPAAPSTDDPGESIESTVERAVDEAMEAVELDDDRRFRWRSREDNAIVHIGEDAHLAKDDYADAVVSIFGSATALGEVKDVVVAVFGDMRAEGPVGEAAVAVFGNAYVNNHVGQEAGAVFGDLTLGPDAEIDGDVFVIGGRLNRDPGAIIDGKVEQIVIGEGFDMAWLRTWIEHCLLYGRPLAFESGLGWAWSLAFAFLAFYVLLAVMFGDALNRCVDTLETRPGESLLAALLSIVLTPVAFFVLLITVVGIVLMPFLGLALFVAGLFGKAAVLGWFGRRVTRVTGIGAFSQIIFAVLIGGLLLMLLYTVPVLGFIMYKVVGLLGLGVVLYTLLLTMQAKRAAAAPPPAGIGAGPVGVGEAIPGDATASAALHTNELAAPRAGFWIRMAALFIDLILIGVAVSILADDGALLVVLAGYGALMWKLRGTTVGGIVCNLQVVRTDGRDIEWDTAIVRALSCFVSLIPAGLGFLWIAFDRDRQAWHDKIAGTVVVRVPRVASLASPAPSAPAP